MKFSLLTSVLALFTLGNSAALPTSSSHHIDKRYVLSNTLGVQYNGKTAYMVQVISGVAMSNLLNTCLSNSGADWAQSFVANLADQWDREGGAATLLHTWGFYATSNTAGLFCTTLAGELVFSTRVAAEQFRQLMVNYLPTKRSLVSGVNEAFDILPPTPPIDANNTLSTRNAGSCSNHCNVNFINSSGPLIFNNGSKASLQALTLTPAKPTTASFNSSFLPSVNISTISLVNLSNSPSRDVFEDDLRSVPCNASKFRVGPNAYKLIENRRVLTQKETSGKRGIRRKSGFAEEEEGYMFVEEGFRIRFNNGEVIDFYADTGADKKGWIKVLDA
ncbi:hypothetical protein OIDMADRAFT_146103 [Oidiodendron maius Zn]|uniref:Peptidase A1 domain-containing protein n=1 Tax=Oidiodendron maius (strain Zn) TaxID=913774 RepID=A0A0C3DFL8_OIDMZ|nr:hypothetical protein OIDMADRAFT_146103 [Oidiodendron maius Zn]